MLEAAFGWTDSPARSIEEANRLARKSLELDERESIAYMALGQASALAGQRQQMIAALERAVELNPSNASCHGRLGFALSHTGQPDEAIEYLESALRLSPKDQLSFMWLTGMGVAHFSEGRYEESASWLEQSRKRRPDFNVTHRALAATYAQLGRLEEARVALQEDLRLAPNESVAFIRQQLRHATPDYLEPYIDGLRKAGLKE